MIGIIRNLRLDFMAWFMRVRTKRGVTVIWHGTKTNHKRYVGRTVTYIWRDKTGQHGSPYRDFRCILTCAHGMQCGDWSCCLLYDGDMIEFIETN